MGLYSIDCYLTIVFSDIPSNFQKCYYFILFLLIIIDRSEDKKSFNFELDSLIHHSHGGSFLRYALT